jgi:hypothetical protein
MRGLRWPAASCLAGPALQPQMLAAWRRPSRGAPTGPRCPGRMCSGRPYEAADTCCGRARAQRPSGEHGFRGVARVFSLRGERGEKSSIFLLVLGRTAVSVRRLCAGCAPHSIYTPSTRRPTPHPPSDPKSPSKCSAFASQAYVPITNGNAQYHTPSVNRQRHTPRASAQRAMRHSRFCHRSLGRAPPLRCNPSAAR